MRTIATWIRYYARKSVHSPSVLFILVLWFRDVGVREPLSSLYADDQSTDRPADQANELRENDEEFNQPDAKSRHDRWRHDNHDHNNNNKCEVDP